MNLGFKRFLYTVILDQIRQEFSGLVSKIKSELGIKVPNSLAWVIAIGLQNVFFLMAILVFQNLRSTQLWPIVATVVLIFNLFLPRTIARRSAYRIANHPLYETLRLSVYEEGQLIFAWLIAETILFWIRDFF